MRDRDFERVIDIAQASVIWRAASSVAHVWSSAITSSFAVRVVRRIAGVVVAWQIEERMRFIALSLAWAGAGYAIALLVLPRYATSGLPLAWLAMFIVAALVAAASPNAFIRAWNEKVNRPSTPA